MSERLNVSLSKSDKVKAFGGSNPPLCATKLKFYLGFELDGLTLVGRVACQTSFALQNFVMLVCSLRYAKTCPLGQLF